MPVCWTAGREQCDPALVTPSHVRVLTELGVPTQCYPLVEWPSPAQICKYESHFMAQH